MQRQYIVKLIGNVSDWLSYAGGALVKVADSAGSTVMCCHGNHAISHNKNGFVIEEHIFFLHFSGLIEPFCINKNTPRGSIEIQLPPPSSLSNGFALLFSVFINIHEYANEIILYRTII